MTDRLGHYPTEVRLLAERNNCGLWLKDDGQTHPLYGGNKVRKLDGILAAARRSGARRLVTFGAAGSHHALSCALFGTQAGFEVRLLLAPQHRTTHVDETLRLSLATGAEIVPCPDGVDLATHTVRARLEPDALLIPPGGSSVAGMRGFVAAARELEAQVAAGELPEPREIYVALGSGGTVAGLLAGLESTRLKSRVVGVPVFQPAWPAARPLIRALLHLLKRDGLHFSVARALGRLHTQSAHAGAGYGLPTSLGQRAVRYAQNLGLQLEPTYTAKAFGAALERLEHPIKADATLGNESQSSTALLYWHTLSAAQPAQLLAAAPDRLPEELQRLLIGR